MRKIILFSLFSIPCISFIVLANAREKAGDRKIVVVTTTQISAIVREIGGDRVQTVTLVPGGMCPGHFDIEPAMAKKIADADLFISHDWEKWADSILSGLNGGKLHRATVKTPGSLMVPENNIKAADELVSALCLIDQKNISNYKRNLRVYEKRIAAEAGFLRNKFGKYNGKKAICSEHQKELLQWLGFNILAVYGRQEDMSMKKVKEIMKAGRNGNADIVVDNIQSGAEAGSPIADDLKIPHVALTNFPQAGSYLETLKHNLNELEQALK